jgi:hypothetical protein
VGVVEVLVVVVVLVEAATGTDVSRISISLVMPGPRFWNQVGLDGGVIDSESGRAIV